VGIEDAGERPPIPLSDGEQKASIASAETLKELLRSISV
jgi:hypothetical protein